MSYELRKGDALDLIVSMSETPDLIVTDPPYALRADWGHAMTITAIVSELIERRTIATKDTNHE